MNLNLRLEQRPADERDMCLRYLMLHRKFERSTVNEQTDFRKNHGPEMFSIRTHFGVGHDLGSAEAFIKEIEVLERFLAESAASPPEPDGQVGPVTHPPSRL